MQSTVTSPQSPQTGLSDHAVSDALGLWEPKRTLTLEAARKHSARIRLMRKFLVLTSAALIGVVVWQFMNQPAGFNLVDNPEETVRMTSPKYSGRTSDGLPYYLTAEEAVRSAAASTAVNLDNILNLSDTVNLETDDGYACRTSEAKIFTKDKRISGNALISCKGNFGDVSGNSYTITDDYKVYTFAGGMTATITRDASASSNESFGFDGDGPINVEAQTASYEASITTLSGDVDVAQGASRVTSDDMIIYRAQVDKGALSASEKSIKLGAITEIDAKGNFLYIAPNRRLSGNRGVYDREKNIITVTGNVELKQDDGTVVTGETLVYDMDKKRAKVGETCTGDNCKRFNFEIPRD